MSHVPSQPQRLPSPRGMISHDSYLPHNARNSMGTAGNVFEDLLALEGPSSSFFENPRKLTSSSCELRPCNNGNTMRHREGFRRKPRVQQYRLLDVPQIMRPGILCIILEELILFRGTLSRNCISENHQTQVAFNESQFQDRSVSTPFRQLTMSWINEAEMAR